MYGLNGSTEHAHFDDALSAGKEGDMITYHGAPVALITHVVPGRKNIYKMVKCECGNVNSCCHPDA